MIYDIFKNKWSFAQTIWIISDTHFGDKELREGFKNRPSDDELVKIINSKVGRKDILIHLGDVGDISYIQKLHGYKILIMGNHDSGKSNYLKNNIFSVFPKNKYNKERAIKSMALNYPNYNIVIEKELPENEPYINWCVNANNGLFDEVYEGPLMIGEKLILSHEPLGINWAMNIHGHEHKGNSSGVNVCLDACGYSLLNLNQFLKGGCANIKSLHRNTIDNAAARKNKRKDK